MSIRTATAIRFNRSFESGRTNPQLITVRVKTDDEELDVVVKLAVDNERNTEASASELVANRLGTALGLRLPEPFLVEFPPGFETIAPTEALREKFRNVISPEFATRYEPGLLNANAENLTSPEKAEEAFEILLFDSLIQNPDRRVDKPNLLEHSDGFLLIDHELSLSFFMEGLIGGAPKPWITSNIGSISVFMKKHLFFDALRKRVPKVCGDSFVSKLGAIEASRIEAIFDEVPLVWWRENDFKTKLRGYLQEGIENAAEIRDNMKSLFDL